MLLPDCEADHRQHQLQAVSHLPTHCAHTPPSQNFSLPSLAPLTFIPDLCFENCLVWSMLFCPFSLYERGSATVMFMLRFLAACYRNPAQSGLSKSKTLLVK